MGWLPSSYMIFNLNCQNRLHKLQNRKILSSRIYLSSLYLIMCRITINKTCQKINKKKWKKFLRGFWYVKCCTNKCWKIFRCLSIFERYIAQIYYGLRVTIRVNNFYRRQIKNLKNHPNRDYFHITAPAVPRPNRANTWNALIYI